ncbi:MAG: N-methyl-L-tryptophan oxidase [Parvularculaceae bacterium]
MTGNAAYDVAVVGLGVMGAACAAYAASAGLSVVGFDARRPPHDRGSSHGETRLLRVSYAEGEAYVPLARRARDLWRTLGDEAGEALFEETGVLYAGPPTSALLTGVKTAAAKHGLALSSPLNDSALAPRLQPAWEAIFEDGAGFLRAEDALCALLEKASRAGAALRPGVGARATPDGGAIEAAGEIIRAQRIILCVGAWLPDAAMGLAPALAGALRLQRQTLHWYDAGPAFTRAAGFKPFVLAAADDAWIYGFPSIDGATLKAANHFGGARIASPNDLDAPVDEAAAARIDAALADAFPDLGPRRRSKNCIYTMTPDEAFAIGPVRENVLVVGGMSGHGFKFAPAIGEAAATWSATGALPDGFDMFSPARFA